MARLTNGTNWKLVDSQLTVSCVSACVWACVCVCWMYEDRKISAAIHPLGWIRLICSENSARTHTDTALHCTADVQYEAAGAAAVARANTHTSCTNVKRSIDSLVGLLGYCVLAAAAAAECAVYSVQPREKEGKWNELIFHVPARRSKASL